jgi:hypothetical protein
MSNIQRHRVWDSTANGPLRSCADGNFQTRWRSSTRPRGQLSRSRTESTGFCTVETPRVSFAHQNISCPVDGSESRKRQCALSACSSCVHDRNGVVAPTTRYSDSVGSLAPRSQLSPVGESEAIDIGRHGVRVPHRIGVTGAWRCPNILV